MCEHLQKIEETPTELELKDETEHNPTVKDIHEDRPTYRETADREIKYLGGNVQTRRYGDGERPSRTLSLLLEKTGRQNITHFLRLTYGR